MLRWHPVRLSCLLSVAKECKTNRAATNVFKKFINQGDLAAETWFQKSQRVFSSRLSEVK